MVRVATGVDLLVLESMSVVSAAVSASTLPPNTLDMMERVPVSNGLPIAESGVLGLELSK